MISSSQLKKQAKYVADKIHTSELSIKNYVTTDNLLQNKLGVVPAATLPAQDGNVTAYKSGDILVANIRPYLKKLWYATQDGGCSADVLAIRPSSKVNSKFLYYALFRDDFFTHVMNGSKGTKMPRGDKSQIMDFLIPNFEIDEQQKIASVLSALDNKIELNNRINAELEAMAKSLYDYWFVQFNFPDANGKPYKTSGGKMVYSPILKRKIPEGWQVKKLAKITSLIRRGISPKYTETGGLSVLNQKCIRDQKISFEDSRRHQLELSDEDERLLRLFDVVINSTGVGTLGRVAYVKRLLETKTTVDSHVTIVRANDALVSPQYLAWEMMRYQPLIEAAANGSTGQVELNKSFLEDIDIIVPEDLITQKFIEFIEPIVPVLAKRESENEYLVSLRNWLLPMLMNGQVTVT